MSGHKGVKAHILSLIKLALYTHCFAHSLNLVGNNAVNCCTTVIGFFDIVQQICTFFSASTRRWDILLCALQSNDDTIPVFKRHTETCWSCYADAVKAFRIGYKEIRNDCYEIANDEHEKLDVRQEALAV